MKWPHNSQSKTHRIAFEIPCILRVRYGRIREARPIITTTRVEYNVREVPDTHDEIVFAYAVHLGTKAEGNTHFMSHNGGIYVTTRHHDTRTSENGWPEGVYQAHTPLYARLWNDVLVEALSSEVEPLNVHDLVTALTADNAPDRREAWDCLQGYSTKYKALPETKDDIARAVERASSILDGLIVHRREILIRTGQPCYRLRIKGRTVSVSIGNTDLHHRMRAADFTHPVVYPNPHQVSGDRSEQEVFYFPGADPESLRSFIEELGLTAATRLPKFSRFEWATHAEEFDGLELDRVARVAVHQIAFMSRAQSMLALADPLLRFDRTFYDAFMNLRDFLAAGNDPEETGEELWALLAAVKNACLRPSAGSNGILHDSTIEFLDRALNRFADRSINVDMGLPAGALPPSP